jgi:hypothetical protein
VEVGPIFIAGVSPVKAESAKIGTSGLRNWALQFSLKLQIVFQIDQAQIVRVSQGVAR